MEAVANPWSFLNLRKNSLQLPTIRLIEQKNVQFPCRKGSQLFRKWWSLAFGNKVAAQAANQTILGRDFGMFVVKGNCCLSYQKKRPSKNLGSSASPNCIVFFVSTGEASHPSPSPNDLDISARVLIPRQQTHQGSFASFSNPILNNSKKESISFHLADFDHNLRHIKQLIPLYSISSTFIHRFWATFFPSSTEKKLLPSQAAKGHGIVWNLAWLQVVLPRFFRFVFWKKTRFDATQNQDTLDDIHAFPVTVTRIIRFLLGNPSKLLFALESWAGGVDPKRIPGWSTKKTLKAIYKRNVGNFQLWW